MTLLKARIAGSWVWPEGSDPVTPPDPEEPVLPDSDFIHGDDMTQSNASVLQDQQDGGVWGQESIEGTGSITWLDDGPLTHKYRDITLTTGRRYEIGQVNEDTGFVYEPGSEYLTRQWHRIQEHDWGSARSNLMQMKHSSDTDGDMHGGFGGNPITPAPPLSLKQFAGGVEVIERSGDYNGRQIWAQEITPDEWWEIAYHVVYDNPDGFIAIYFRYEGDEFIKVHESERPTSKLNTNGQLMYSTYRVGHYGDDAPLPRSNHIGPTWQGIID